MMLDLKPEILQALRNNAALALLLGKDLEGNVKVYPEVSPYADAEPYITFFELTNFGSLYTDDEEAASEIHFQIDIWSKGNTGPIAQEVDKSMKDLGFGRTSSADLYEDETKTFHKALRYKTNRFIEE